MAVRENCVLFDAKPPQMVACSDVVADWNFFESPRAVGHQFKRMVRVVLTALPQKEYTATFGGQRSDHLKLSPHGREIG